MTVAARARSQTGSKYVSFSGFDPWGESQVEVPEWTERETFGRYLGGTSNSPRKIVGVFEEVCSLGSPWVITTTARLIDHAIRAVTPEVSPESVPSILATIRRLTGYGWDSIAELVGCTRQAVHNWNVGGSISPANKQRLNNLYATVKFIDRGDQEANQSVLNSVADGQSLFEHLSGGKFDFVKACAGVGPGRQDRSWGAVVSSIETKQNWHEEIDETSEVPDTFGVAAQTFRPARIRKG